jgi:F-box domain
MSQAQLPRRVSARLKTKSEITSINAKPIPESHHDSAPKRRRQNVTVVRQPKRRVEGKLKLMTEMPLDVLFETFIHLQPHDLLSLSQASRSLRAILLNPTATSIWKSVRPFPSVSISRIIRIIWLQAFLNIDPGPKPPGVPSDMNIVQYAGLLYGRHCHVCCSAEHSILYLIKPTVLCIPESTIRQLGCS